MMKGSVMNVQFFDGSDTPSSSVVHGWMSLAEVEAQARRFEYDAFRFEKHMPNSGNEQYIISAAAWYMLADEMKRLGKNFVRVSFGYTLNLKTFWQQRQ